MTREARANLIFIVVLCLFSAPGLAILMHKKLTGSTRSNALPDPVPVATAYMQPPPFPPSLPKREPLVVRDWVRQMVQGRLGGGVRVMRDGPAADAGPLVSDRFVTQLAGFRPAADGTLQAGLLRWDASTLISMTDPVITARVGDREVTAKTLRVESMTVPRDVRHAIQDVGYVDPPAVVWWIEISIPTAAGDPAPRSLTLRRGPTNEASAAETITLPGAGATRPAESDSPAAASTAREAAANGAATTGAAR